MSLTPKQPGALSMRRSVLVGIAAVGMLAYASVAVFTDSQRLGAALHALGWAGVVLILLLSLLNYLFRFWRWNLYITRLAHRLPVLDHCLYYLSGLTYTVSPGKVGEAMRSVYLRRHGVTLAMTLVAMFAERLLDLGVVVLLATLVALANPRYAPLVIGAALVLGVMGALIASQQLPRWIERLSVRLKPGRVLTALQALTRLLDSSGLLLRPQMLLLGAIAGLLAWVAEGVGFQLICNGLGIHISLSAATGVYALALLAGNVAIFMPGGIGGTELVMTALLTARGVPLSTAVIATILCRLATLWFAVVIGFVATAILELSPARRRRLAAP